MDEFLHSHGSQVLLGSQPNHGAPPEGSSRTRFVFLAHSSTSLGQSVGWLWREAASALPEVHLVVIKGEGLLHFS